MPTIHEQLLAEGFREVGKIGPGVIVEDIHRIDNFVRGLDNYQTRIVPFYLAHGIEPQESQVIERVTHSVYIKDL